MVTVTVSLALLLSTGMKLEELNGSTLPQLAVRSLAERLTFWGFDLASPITLQKMPDGETFRLAQ